MRLSCPNCGAQYEVPLEVIPTAGRDVQCSNCGHTWFQIHPDEDIELAEEVGGSTPDQGWMPAGTEAGDVVAREAAEDPVDQSEGDEVQPPEIRFEEDDQPEESVPTEEETASEADAPEESETSTEEVDEPDLAPEFEETADVEAEDTPLEDTLDVEAEDITEDQSDEVDETPAEPEVQDQTDNEPDTDHDDTADQEADTEGHEESEEEASETETDETDSSEDEDVQAVRNALDPAVADVLRQEAEYETQAREADAVEALEMQQELGLDDRRDEEDEQGADARARMLRIRGLTDSSDEDTPSDIDTAAHHSRRELLPDIEEINSTLRSTDDRNATEAASGAVPTKARRRNGFRLGVALMVLVATLLLVTYSFNREITKSYPAAEPAVAALMQTMNGARVWLDSLVTDGMLWLNHQAEVSSENLE